MSRNKARNKRERVRFYDKFSDFADVFSGECLEMSNRHEIYIHGCEKILKYTSAEIILGLKKDTVSVNGSELVCISYFSGSVLIRGKIAGINFRGGDGNEI